MNLLKSDSELAVYSEGARIKIFVGSLKRINKGLFQFEYTREYLKSKGAIGIGQDLPISKIKHTTKSPTLFASFADRIPSRSNPAYGEYCEDTGISPDENNPIVLLTTIGRRGPSTFVFEPIYLTEEEQVPLRLKEFRKKTGVSLRIVAEAFNFNFVTLQRVEQGTSKDRNTIRLLHIYLHNASLARWVITINSPKLSQKIVADLLNYFKKNEA
jgi:HipA-like protein